MANAIRLTLPVRTPSATVVLPGMYGAAAVFRVQSSSSETGTFADLTGTDSTPTVPIVSGTETYMATDPGGTSMSWYRARLEDSGATRVSDWSVVTRTVYPL